MSWESLSERCGESVDYLTFVPDGEPTLDTFLGYEIELLKSLEIRFAVITNASLIWRKDVRADFMKADWVSLKVDAVQMEIWKQLNRPHGRLTLDGLKYGMLEFAGTYRGTLVTETMLIKGLNDRKADSQFLFHGKADWSVIEKLLAEDQLVETEYEGERFFVRKFFRVFFYSQT